MDDSHYCLKCGSTLIGLDNYINHRKVPCDSAAASKMYDETNPCDVPKMEVTCGKAEEERTPSCDDGPDKKEKVEADDFFSSLELQSSSKTTSNAGNPNVPSKSSGGIVTRSKSLLPVKMPERVEASPRGAKAKTPGKGRKVKKRRLLLSSRKKTTKGSDAKRGSGKEKKEAAQKRQGGSGGVRWEDDGAGLGLDRTRYEDDWNLFNQLVVKKDVEDKVPECRRVNEPPGPIRRYTPELFSMSPVLITDELSEDKEVEVDKFLEDDDYNDDDGYLNLEDVDEFSYAPPRCHTGGKWKPGSLSVRTSPMLWPSQTWDSLLEERHPEEEGRPAESPTDLAEKCKAPLATLNGGKWKSYNPPSSHTGGKWKPSETPQTLKKVSQDVPPAMYTGGKWHPGKPEPPATHTGGKWKPQISPGQQMKAWKGDGSGDAPPSEHSRGKWVPSSSKNSVDNKTLNVIASCQSTSGKCLKTAGGLIQYYCSPCNRRLASKKMYKKHVLSELHLKRVLQENELEFDSRSIKMFRGLFSVMTNEQRGLGKRAIKKPEFFKDMEMGGGKRAARDVKSDGVKRKRLPRKELIRCDVCKAKLASHQLGKHLVSYYHSRRIRLNEPEQQKLVLDNIHAIVRQAPYQCGVCKFYFNTHRLFKKHWASDEHKWMEETDGKMFWCVLCNFECETSRSMELHLDSNSHREVIMAVNKSIPIIIRQKQILNCKMCDKKFRYNFALIRHNRISHGLNETENVKVYPCTHCKYKSKTVKSLQRHVLRRHKGIGKVPYFCSACDVYFPTAEDARTHRRSQPHRSRSLAKRDGTTGAVTSRSCPYCGASLPDVDKLKTHIGTEHPELRPGCSKCGKLFNLPQEVARHKKTCTFLRVAEDRPPTSDPYRCRVCAYSSALKSDVLYHETLHDAPGRGDSRKLLCPVCGNAYRMLALRNHLRTHTGERPYECRTCSKSFARKSRLIAHWKFGHRAAAPGDEEDAKPVADITEEVVEVVDADDVDEKKIGGKSSRGSKNGDSKGKAAVKDAEDADRHSKAHLPGKVFQCPHCNYQAKTNTLLKRHNKIHLDERSYLCPHCPFRGRLASHLKRHLRLHTGAKPYKCPHCPYECNILENLRKHVLYTKIHPGKMLYECKMCTFTTNASSAFKQHLLEKHGDKFGAEVAITAYVAGIYNVEEDVQTAVNPVPVKQKAAPTPPKTDRSTVLKNIAILTKKFEPIAPRPTKNPSSPKPLGNSVQDKRKVLEMELEKLKNQAKKKPPLPPIRSYPTPTILKAERDAKAKATASAAAAEPVKPARREPAAEEAAGKKDGGPQLTVAINQIEASAGDPSPTYVPYESGISFEDNEDHLAEQGFYLL